MSGLRNLLPKITVTALFIGISAACSDSELSQENKRPMVIAVVGDGVPPIDLAADRRFPLNRAQGELMYKGVKSALSSSKLRTIEPLVELVTRDDAGDPRLAATIARELRRNPRVIAVIGHATSETTQAAAPIYSAAGIPLLMPIATSPNVMFAEGELNDRHRRLQTLFRLPPADHIAQAPAVGWLITHSLKSKKVALIKDITPGAVGYSDPLTAAIKPYISALICVEQVANRSSPNLHDLITSIRAENPDTILFCGYGSTITPILEALRQSYASVSEADRPTIVLTDGCLGPDLNPKGFLIYVLFPHAELREAYSTDDREDIEALRKVFGDERGSHYGLFGCDAMLVIGHAISNCPKATVDRFALLEVLNSGRRFIGSAGIYEFRDGENSESAYDVYQAEASTTNSTFTPITTINAQKLDSMRQTVIPK